MAIATYDGPKLINSLDHALAGFICYLSRKAVHCGYFRFTANCVIFYFEEGLAIAILPDLFCVANTVLYREWITYLDTRCIV